MLASESKQQNSHTHARARSFTHKPKNDGQDYNITAVGGFYGLTNGHLSIS